jgi:hypothetical protein
VRGLFDIATHQVYLKAVPDELMFPGFVTKLIRDLSGIPHVWPCLHLEALGAYYSPDEVREVLSQTFIAGSTGVHTWPIPGRGTGPYIDRLDAPGRQYMFEQFKSYAGTLEAKHGSDKEVALLYSNDSCNSHADEYGIPQPVRAYQYLSDGCAVNFRFVGDLGIKMGQDNVEEYKLLFVPVAHIVHRKVTEKILSAVEKGMNLIVVQPDAFSFCTDGTGTENFAISLRGGARLLEKKDMKSGYVIPEPESKIFKGSEVRELPFMGSDYSIRFTDLTPYRKPYTFINLPPDSEVVLRYEDDSPAAVLVEKGKGKALWLGFSPLIYPYSREWTDFFRSVFSNWGIVLDRPVWRLLLPLTFEREKENYFYLTGNGYNFECSIPQITQNIYLPGSYRYSVLPDRVKENGIEDIKTQVPFTRGKLTDRTNPDKQAYVTYMDTQEVTVDFDLSTPCKVARIDAYLSAFLPETTLLSSTDGQDYKAVGRIFPQEKTDGVRKLSFQCRDTAGENRYWRLVFGERPEGEQLTIVEVDILQKIKDR